ncbi:hypothetical protein [Syntrophomonas palmitatica]|uniref:hypothetical protein n=1 Tax=Syntrophomonas palmitatica TaxID=402877 RepID=UPI0006D1168A|nr:hypothetical protein [Syntrophomonas palmitatica]
MIISPSLLIGITPKYQQWVQNGSIGYTVNYFSFFGVILFIGTIILWIYNNIKNKYVRQSYVMLTVLLITYVSIATDYSNNLITKSQNLSQDKWRIVDFFLKTDQFNNIPENSVILAPSLWNYHGIVQNFPEYWSDYFTYEGKKHVTVCMDQSEFKRSIALQNNPSAYFIKYSQEPKESNQFLIFASLIPDNIENNERLFTNEFLIISNSKNKKATIFGQTYLRGKKLANIYLNGNLTLSTENDFYSLSIDDNNKKNSPFVLNIINSDKPIDLESTSLTYFTDHNRIKDISYEWGKGFYSLEGVPDQNWRWCDANGELTITNFTGKTKKALVSMGVNTGYSEMSNLTIESDLFSDKLCINSSGKLIRRELIIPEGTHQIIFKSDAKRVVAPSDPRTLVFMVRNFKIIFSD